MTPYQCTSASLLKQSLILVTLVISFGVNHAYAGDSGDSSGSSTFDTLTQSGFEHFYNLEYDQAIQDFHKAMEAKPDDPKGVNHLLDAVLFSQLYKHDALDTSLYTQQSFLSSKQINLDPKVI